MKPRACRKGAADPGERGFALIAILALAALVSAFLIASALNFSGAGVSNEREQRNLNALRQAKEALIAHAASEQQPGYFQPGALLCPDQDNNGDADCLLPNTASMIGRVPYKTLGIEDLRDASGERLWYALSHDFRKLRCEDPTPAAGCTRINSDTQGQLTVIGDSPATQVVAVLFAPGAPIPGQNRPSNSAVDYLESFDLDNPANINYIFTSKTTLSDNFNDRVLVITQADVMAAVEPVVAGQIERDVKPLLTDYFDAWGAYPFAVPFASPPAAPSSYLGAGNQTQGLLPVSSSASFNWASASVTQLASGGTGNQTVNSWSCAINSPPLRAVCQVNYGTGGSDRPAIRLDVFLANANLGFANAPSPLAATHQLTMVRWDGNPVDMYPSPFGQWSQYSNPIQFTPTRSLTSQMTGGVLSYSGRLQNGNDNGGQVTITVALPSPPSYQPRLTNANPTVPNITWFISNEWYRQTYYAVSPGYAPGGTPGGVAAGSPATCSPLPATPSCLTVNNLPAPSNKRAILVLTGRALNGSARPSANPKDYLEGENCNLVVGKDLDVGSSPSTCNLTTSDYVFEHRSGAPTSINDRVVVVSP